VRNEYRRSTYAETVNLGTGFDECERKSPVFRPPKLPR
jgi:hypothetical protein